MTVLHLLLLLIGGSSIAMLEQTYINEVILIDYINKYNKKLPPFSKTLANLVCIWSVIKLGVVVGFESLG